MACSTDNAAFRSIRSIVGRQPFLPRIAMQANITTQAVSRESREPQDQSTTAHQAVLRSHLKNFGHEARGPHTPDTLITL